MNPQRFDQLILSRDLRAVPWGLEHCNNRAEQDGLETADRMNAKAASEESIYLSGGPADCRYANKSRIC